MLDGPMVRGWDLADGPDQTVMTVPELKLRIDDDFKALCPPLQDDERERLSKSIERDGIRDAVLVWPQKDLKGVAVVLDGHNRIEIANQLGVDFEYDVVEGIGDREAAKRWILENQLGRRNLSPTQATFLRGKLYEHVKQPRGGDRRSKARKAPAKRAAEQVAEQTGVDPATVKRDAKFTRAVDKLAEDDPKNRARILSPDSGQKKISRSAVIAIAAQPDAGLRQEMLENACRPQKRPPKLVAPALAGRLSALLAQQQLLEHAPEDVARAVPIDQRRETIEKTGALRNWLEEVQISLT